MKIEVIDGYYFNEGHNSQINNVISFLYSKRQQLKKRQESNTISYQRIDELNVW